MALAKKMAAVISSIKHQWPAKANGGGWHR